MNVYAENVNVYAENVNVWIVRSFNRGNLIFCDEEHYKSPFHLLDYPWVITETYSSQYKQTFQENVQWYLYIFFKLELDVAFVGVPVDQGASTRSGARFGPRQIRSESVLIREANKETGM